MCELTALRRIFTIPKLGEKLKQDTTPLSYTPRKFISHPYHPVFYVVEADHRTYGPKTIERILGEKVSNLVDPKHETGHQLMLLKEASGSRVDRGVLDLSQTEFGRPRAGPGQWASTVRILDPVAVRELICHFE